MTSAFSATVHQQWLLSGFRTSSVKKCERAQSHASIHGCSDLMSTLFLSHPEDRISQNLFLHSVYCIFLKIYFVVYLCLCACLPPVYAYMHKPEEGIMPSWAGITDSSELPNVGAGNKTLVPLKEHKHSYPMSHLFRSLALTFFQLSLLQCSLGLSHSGFGTEQSLILSPLTSYGSTNHLASQKAWST